MGNGDGSGDSSIKAFTYSATIQSLIEVAICHGYFTFFERGETYHFFNLGVKIKASLVYPPDHQIEADFAKPTQK
eukprot:scaffold252010_cov21-Tisochrysis_lutea.AAC.1